MLLCVVKRMFAQRVLPFLHSSALLRVFSAELDDALSPTRSLKLGVFAFSYLPPPSLLPPFSVQMERI